MQRYTWIFSLLSPVSEPVAASLRTAFEAFQGQWKSHGTPVSGMIQLHHNQFVVVQANNDEGRPSGCSIDSLRRGVTAILAQQQLAWADGCEIFYRQPNGSIAIAHFHQIPALVENGSLGPDSIVFDHTLGDSDDLTRWELPMNQTWMKRYLVSASKQKQ